MNFNPQTYRLIRAWIHAHENFRREIVTRLRSVYGGTIGQPFNGDDIEYFVTQEGIGYKVELDVDLNNGMLQYSAVPGRFVPSNVGPMWVNGKTGLHSEIERRCDQNETSLIIQ